MRPQRRTRRGALAARFRVALLCAGTLACAQLAAASPASAAGGLTTGFADFLTNDLYSASDDSIRNLWFQRTVDARAGIVRLNVEWRRMVGSQRPADPGSPADPAYDFTTLDRTVRTAQAYGLDIFFTVYGAPDWAEGPNRSDAGPVVAPPGTWDPNPADFADFGHALASRYSGTFAPGPGLEPLPRVDSFEAWNEPNLSSYLTPQWRNHKPASPAIYRRLLNAFYDAVHAVQPNAQVISGGTGPYGDPPGGPRMRPLYFLRTLFCLKLRRDKQLKPKACSSVPRMDVLAHHPINFGGGPYYSAIHPDDASTGDMRHVGKVLNAAEKYDRVAPAGKRPLWATELWWETNPPDTFSGVSELTQAVYLEAAQYVLWRQGASVVVLLQIRDDAYDPAAPHLSYQTGIYFADGQPKLAAQAIRFPFVTEPRGRAGRLVAWVKAPASGSLTIERKLAGQWQPVKTLAVSEGGVYTTKLGLSGRQVLRATLGGEQSLVWVQGKRRRT